MYMNGGTCIVAICDKPKHFDHDYPYLSPSSSKMAKASVYLSLRISLSDMARGIVDPL